MRKIPIKFFNSFEEAQDDYYEEVFSMSPDDRVAAVEVLRRRYFSIKNLPLDLKVQRVVKLADVSEK